MFVKFACGCIGLKTGRPANYNDGWTKALVLYVCNGDGPGFAFYFRDVRDDKPATPLTEAETDAFVERFGRHFGRAVASLDAMENLKATLEFLARAER